MAPVLACQTCSPAAQGGWGHYRPTAWVTECVRQRECSALSESSMDSDTVGENSRLRAHAGITLVHPDNAYVQPLPRV